MDNDSHRGQPKTGLQMMQALLNDQSGIPIGETMQFTLAQVEPGRAVFRAAPGPHAYNAMGVAHGGYAATVLDSACGCAVHASLDASQGYTTLELKVAYHKAITTQTGPMEAEGKVVSIGRRIAFAEARLMDSQGRLYASATSTLLIFEARPT